MSKLGARPELRWLDKRLLVVEPVYQRELSQHRSQALVTKIAENWSWVHCSVLIVAATDDGKWTIIDGQHRHQASLRRDDIKDLPCLLVDAKSTADRARAFVAHNRDRVTLHFLALFHADVAAGDAIACAVVKAAEEVGITILRSAKSVSAMAPTETMAVGALCQIARKMGIPTLIRVLRCVMAAYPATDGQLRSNTFKAAASVHSLGVSTAVITRALSETDGQKLEDGARAYRGSGMSIPQGFAETLAQACGTTTIKPPSARSLKRHKAKVGATRTPFRFDRSQPAKPTPPATPIVTRDNVQVRKIEPGDMMALVTRALESAGVKVERARGRLPYKLNGKLVTFEDMVTRADEIRKKKGLPPLRRAA